MYQWLFRLLEMDKKLEKIWVRKKKGGAGGRGGRGSNVVFQTFCDFHNLSFLSFFIIDPSPIELKEVLYSSTWRNEDC
jgi:hypothetical protein